jgi:sodium transport system permease protein
MSWTNVKLIWFREVRDQLRDRRTIFTIAVLPLLLYPLLGMSFLHITQFMKEHPTRIWLIGSSQLPDEPALLDGPRFAARYCPENESRLLQVTVSDAAASVPGDEPLDQVARREIRRENYDAVVYFPPDFARHLDEIRSELTDAGNHQPLSASEASLLPQPEIFVNAASDKSRIAADRAERVLSRWRKDVVRGILASSRVSPQASEPFEVTRTDVSEEVRRRAAMWSKILPFVVLIWALTGAFYPAIDLCAGEKERGTLETLLSSPAHRSEIVGGKLLTVMTFSAATALLNLFSMGATGTFIIRQIEQMPNVGASLDIGPPPLSAIGWLVLAIVPIAALFSALALAIAAFARSSKEGQYYLMPLLLVALPLMTLPLLPAAELEPGTSIIPLTGMMLWLRALIEGQYGEALRYALPVVGVTAGCCWLAIRWAVRQFETESVLFREGERLGLGLWIRHMARDRGETPSVSQSLLGGVLLLFITFYASLRTGAPTSWDGFVRIALITQVVLVAAPTLIMTVMLTTAPQKTLLLNVPRPLALPAAFALALVLHPLVVLLGQGIERLYPLGEDTLRVFETLTAAMQHAPLWQLLLVVALAPALCEELAFRGFILSGLRHIGSKWAAIVISSLFFGLTHGMLQQSLAAAAVGVVIGYLAVQSGSLLPGMVFHFTHNALSVLAGRMITTEIVERAAWLRWLLQPADSRVLPFSYGWPVLVLSAALSFLLLLWFRRLPHPQYVEEQLQEALHHQTNGTPPDAA